MRTCVLFVSIALFSSVAWTQGIQEVTCFAESGNECSISLCPGEESQRFRFLVDLENRSIRLQSCEVQGEIANVHPQPLEYRMVYQGVSEKEKPGEFCVIGEAVVYPGTVETLFIGEHSFLSSCVTGDSTPHTLSLAGTCSGLKPKIKTASRR